MRIIMLDGSKLDCHEITFDFGRGRSVIIADGYRFCPIGEVDHIEEDEEEGK